MYTGDAQDNQPHQGLRQGKEAAGYTGAGAQTTRTPLAGAKEPGKMVGENTARTQPEGPWTLSVIPGSRRMGIATCVPGGPSRDTPATYNSRDPSAGGQHARQARAASSRPLLWDLPAPQSTGFSGTSEAPEPCDRSSGCPGLVGRARTCDESLEVRDQVLTSAE